MSVDSQTNVATITNILTQQQIQDDLAVAAAGEASPPQLTDTTGVSAGVDDITLVKGALSSFAGLFANGLPPAAMVEAALATGFRMEDMDSVFGTGRRRRGVGHRFHKTRDCRRETPRGRRDVGLGFLRAQVATMPDELADRLRGYFGSDGLPSAHTDFSSTDLELAVSHAPSAPLAA